MRAMARSALHKPYSAYSLTCCKSDIESKEFVLCQWMSHTTHLSSSASPLASPPILYRSQRTRSSLTRSGRSSWGQWPVRGIGIIVTSRRPSGYRQPEYSPSYIPWQHRTTQDICRYVLLGCYVMHIAGVCILGMADYVIEGVPGVLCAPQQQQGDPLRTIAFTITIGTVMLEGS